MKAEDLRARLRAIERAPRLDREAIHEYLREAERSSDLLEFELSRTSRGFAREMERWFGVDDDALPSIVPEHEHASTHLFIAAGATIALASAFEAYFFWAVGFWTYLGPAVAIVTAMMTSGLLGALASDPPTRLRISRRFALLTGLPLLFLMIFIGLFRIVEAPTGAAGVTAELLAIASVLATSLAGALLQQATVYGWSSRLHASYEERRRQLDLLRQTMADARALALSAEAQLRFARVPVAVLPAERDSDASLPDSGPAAEASSELAAAELELSLSEPQIKAMYVHARTFMIVSGVILAALGIGLLAKVPYATVVALFGCAVATGIVAARAYVLARADSAAIDTFREEAGQLRASIRRARPSDIGLATNADAIVG